MYFKRESPGQTVFVLVFFIAFHLNATCGKNCSRRNKNVKQRGIEQYPIVLLPYANLRNASLKKCYRRKTRNSPEALGPKISSRFSWQATRGLNTFKLTYWGVRVMSGPSDTRTSIEMNRRVLKKPLMV
jgi:hypothetical protein